MNFILSIIAALILIIGVFAGFYLREVQYFIAVILPYAAFLIFSIGIIYRIVNWGRSPVPFRITTTGGQQKSLPWIKSDRVQNPHTAIGVFFRMLLEILFFRSLFRNTKFALSDGPGLSYGSSKFLWLGSMLFHWSMLIILIRHMRFFAEQTPIVSAVIQNIDGLFEIGIPPLYITNILIICALLFLLVRRLTVPIIRYISLISDYFPLVLIISIASSGILMRHFFRVDLYEIKIYAMSLIHFSPAVPVGIGVIFYIHIFLIFTLMAYIPFSKIIHLAGVFLSPTRNMANTNRMKRHINPWDYPVKVHTYEEWEDEFRDKLKSAGLPLEKE